MNDKALEQIQIKVEAGEPLSEPDVRLLEAAALQEPGPKWRLTIAHALINAERADAALPMMETLVRDAPSHPQTRLGLARALIALDRYGDAERVLKQALADRPSDPEAMKGLAVLALRRDERELARKLVKDVLKQDPFDQEAQLIAAELDPASASAADVAPPVTIASEKAFVDALLAELRAQRVPHRRDGAHLFVKSSGRIGRVDVRALYDSYVAETRPLSEVAAEIARQLGASGSEPLSREELLFKVRPVLRGADFGSRAVGAVSTTLSNELRLFYVIDDPELVRYVPESLATQHGLSVEALHDAAMKQLAAQPAEVKQVRVEGGVVQTTSAGSGLAALWQADGYDGARVFVPELRAPLFGALNAEQLALHFGRRDVTLACAMSDSASIALLRELAPVDGVAGLFRVDRNGSATLL